MDEGRRRDEAVLDRHGTAGRAKMGEQRRPPQAGLGLPRQTVQALHTRIEPSLEPRPALPFGQKENAEPNLTENDRIDDEFALVVPEPLDDAGFQSSDSRRKMGTEARPVRSKGPGFRLVDGWQFDAVG